MTRQSLPFAFVAGLALAILVFHLTQRPVWNGLDPDISLYLLHAGNIVNGSPYASTPYLLNPAHAIHPAAYPPGLPLLMAPLLFFFGIDFAAFNALMVLCFGVLVVVLYFVARPLLSPWASLFVAAAVGLSPFFHRMATMPYSELPFLLAATGGMLLLDSGRGGAGGSAHIPVVRAVFAGLIVGTAMLIRSVGFLLVPAIGLAALVALVREGRQALRGPSIAVAIAVFLVVIVSRLMPHDVGTYVGYASGMSAAELLAGVRGGIRVYLNSLSAHYLGLVRTDWLAGSGPHLLVVAFTLVVAVLGAIGWIIVARERCSVFETFTALYAAFIFVYPIRTEPARYFMPIVPLLALYATFGFSRLARRVPAAIARPAGGALAAAVLACYAASVPKDLSAREPWPMKPAGQALFAAVRQLTEPDAVILAFEPTTIALFTGRRSAIWPKNASAEDFLRYVRDIGAGYVIPRPPGVRFSDLEFETIVSRWPGRFVTAYADAGYSLVRLLPLIPSDATHEDDK